MDQPLGPRDASTPLAPAGGGRWTWWAACLWLPGCVAYAALVAWAAWELAGRFAPLLVFPLLVGMVLGASLAALARLFQMGHRPTAWLALALCVAIVVVGQHYFGYRAALARFEHETTEFRQARAVFGELVRGSLPPPPDDLLDYLRKQAERGRPMDTLFGRYTAKGTVAWLSWALDGLLVLLPAAVLVRLALRRPFCRRCGSWYSARRGGRLDAAAARRLAEELELPAPDAAEGAWYRMIACDEGCTPAGFSLSWEGQPATRQPTMLWLDDGKRARVVQILDESRETS